MNILLETDQKLWFDEAGCRMDDCDFCQGAEFEYNKTIPAAKPDGPSFHAF